MADLSGFRNSGFGNSGFGQAEEVDVADFANASALIVDPAPLHRSILVNQVREFGFRTVSQCARLSDALEKFSANETFDVLLCEYTFLNESTSAIDLIEDLRSKQLLPLSTVVILITGEARYAKVSEAAESGLDAYILKPHRANQLRDRLKLSLIRKKSLHHVFEAILAKEFVKAADFCLERYMFRGPFWLYAARIGAELLMRVKRFNEAQDLYEAIADAQAMPWAKLGVARAQLEDGNYSEATTTLSALIEDEPNFVDAYDVLARAQFDTGDVQKARSTYAMAAKMTPDSIIRNQNFGMMQFYAGDIAEAALLLDKSVRLGRDSKLFDCQTLVALGFTALHAGDRKSLQRCMTDFELLLAKKPDSPRHIRNAQVLRLQMMLLDGQASDLAKAVATIAQVILQPEFEFEAAANLVSLLTYAAKFQLKIERPHEALVAISMRFCTNRSLTDILAGAAFESPSYAEIIKEGGQKVQMIAQNCLSISMRGDPASAIRQLLSEGEKTKNSKFIDSAGQLLARYQAKVKDYNALHVRATALHDKFCHAALNRSNNPMAAPGARGAGELILRA
jgi:CheY-like chemotaxis protein